MDMKGSATSLPSSQPLSGVQLKMMWLRVGVQLKDSLEKSTAGAGFEVIIFGVGAQSGWIYIDSNVYKIQKLITAK
jgi:hypothetical protein